MAASHWWLLSLVLEGHFQTFAPMAEVDCLEVGFASSNLGHSH